MHYLRNPSVFAARRADWRVGCIVYQILVDRFAPSERLAEKAPHYAAPKRLRNWNAPSTRGEWLPAERNVQGELDFYGGDLDSVRRHLDYLASLGVELVYLNPIFTAFTNHKYDAIDFFEIDPQYGNEADLLALGEDAHKRGMKLMLDGVFNHMGRRAHWFLEAQKGGEARDFFVFGDAFRHGYRSWRNHANLPELNVENETLRRKLWLDDESVVQRHLRSGAIDGWRLDVAPDLGFDFLRELTEFAHRARPDCAVIGECWNYPAEWLTVVDGILNMHLRLVILEFVLGKLGAGQAGRAIQRMVDDGGIEGILRCHLVLDNHDTPRLRHLVAEEKQRNLARILQFTLPGAPVLYYGSELGMEGGHDPENRGAMRWDLVEGGNEELALVRKLTQLRRDLPALRVGDFQIIESDKLLAFMRRTDDARGSVVVVINATNETVRELLPVPDSRWMDSSDVVCAWSGVPGKVSCGFLDETVEAYGLHIFCTPGDGVDDGGYSMFKRVL
jgi:glycosidase